MNANDVENVNVLILIASFHMCEHFFLNKAAVVVQLAVHIAVA